MEPLDFVAPRARPALRKGDIQLRWSLPFWDPYEIACTVLFCFAGRLQPSVFSLPLFWEQGADCLRWDCVGRLPLAESLAIGCSAVPFDCCCLPLAKFVPPEHNVALWTSRPTCHDMREHLRPFFLLGCNGRVRNNHIGRSGVVTCQPPCGEPDFAVCGQLQCCFADKTIPYHCPFGLGPPTIGPSGSLVLALTPEHPPAQSLFYLCPPYDTKGTIPNFGARNMRIGRSGTQARTGIDALGRLGPPSRPAAPAEEKLRTAQQAARKMRVGRSGTQAWAFGAWFDEWLYHLSCSARGLFAPLCSILLWGLLKLWIWAIPGRHTPLGRFVRFPFAGQHVGCIAVVGRVASPCSPILPWHAADTRNTRGPRQGRCPANGHGGILTPVGRLLVALVGFGSLPVSHGIRPSGVASAAMTALAVAFLPTGSCMTSGRDDDTGQMCDDRLFWDLEDSAGLHPLQAGLAGEGRPDPGGSGCASSGVVEPATGKIDSLVLAHGYASRVVSSPVPHPITWDSISRDVRAQLDHDMFGFGFDLVPADPQIEPGYLTTVVVPSWVETSDRAVIVLDFTDWNGPVYALITWSRVVPADLVDHLERYVEGPYEIFCAGRSGPMRQEGEELVSGTVIRVSPLHRPPVWGPTLEDCLADTRLCENDYWCMKSEVQSDQWRILGEHCARVVLHQGGLDDALYNHAASALHCRVEALAFRRFECALPAGHLVQYGATLLGVVAGARRPRTAANDSQGHVTFFDCRPVGGLIQFLFTRNDFVPIAGMSQYLGLRVPSGYQVRYQSECVLEHYIPTRDGVVVTVTFVPIPAASSHNRDNSVSKHIPTVVLAGGGADASRPVLNEPKDAPAQQGTEALTFGAANIGVSIFTPRYQAEIVSVEVFTPCDVDDFLCAVQSARQAPCALAIDHLLPVDPQPSCGFASVLAMPEWAAAETFVLIDARSIDGRLFCSVLDNHLARHDFLQHVGVADTPGLHLYIAGKLWPRDTNCMIAAGCLITLCQGALGDEPWYVIEDLLASANGWTLPCPRFPGPWPSVFWVLSNSGFCLFAYQPGRGTSAEDFTDKVCRALGYCPRRTALCSASPRIADAAYMGQDCRGVVVVTENLADVAPATSPDAGQPCVVFLDRRAILMDPTWVFAASGTLSVDNLTAQYEEFLPEGFALVVKGGRQFTRGNGTFLQVERRDVIVLESVRDFLPDSPRVTDSSGAGSDQEDDGESSDTTSDPSQGPGPVQALLHHGRDRSRSPRTPDRYHAALSAIVPWVGPICKPFHVDALGCILDALFGDSRLTKVDASTSPVAHGGFISHAWTLYCNSVKNPSILGVESLRDVVLHIANGGSERTGEHGPHHATCNTTGPPSTAPTGNAPSEGSHADTATGSGAEARHRVTVVDTEQRAFVFVTAHFLVIAQDSAPELLQIRFPVPGQVADVMRLLDGARMPEARDKFPRLCPVFPQPWRLAVVLAGPAWPFPGILVAVDLSTVGGATFALVLPPRTDKIAVMRAAGVSTDADVLLFLRDVPWAIPVDAVFEVSHGDLLQFLPARYPLTHPVSIDAMLLSSAGWDLHWLPEGQFTPALWILAGHEHLRFVVRPFRSLCIRRDLAALLNVPAGDLILRPASPQVQNHAHRGHLTHNVVVAIRADPGHTGRGPRLPICIIDARALHSGFVWYALPDGILRHRTLLDQFGVRCPAGYVLGRLHPNGTVDAIRSNLRMQDGEVIVLVFFVPPPIDLSSSSDDDDDGGSERPESGGHDDTEDTTVGNADSASEVLYCGARIGGWLNSGG